MRHIEIINNKEYAMSKIPAFAANGILLKLQKIVLPVIGGLAGTGQVKSVMDMDVNSAFKTISENIDQSVVDQIIFPMFKLSQVSSVTDNVKIDSEQNFNKVFSVDDLGDFYELVYLVLKFNFGNFFQGLMARFGNNDGNQANQAQILAA